MLQFQLKKHWSFSRLTLITSNEIAYHPFVTLSINFERRNARKLNTPTQTLSRFDISGNIDLISSLIRHRGDSRCWLDTYGGVRIQNDSSFTRPCASEHELGWCWVTHTLKNHIEKTFWVPPFLCNEMFFINTKSYFIFVLRLTHMHTATGFGFCNTRLY